MSRASTGTRKSRRLARLRGVIGRAGQTFIFVPLPLFLTPTSNLQELERKLRDIEKGQAPGAGGSKPAEDRKPSQLSTTSTTAGSSSTFHAPHPDQLPGPSVLTAGSLPSITRLGSGEHHGGSPLPYGSQWAGPPRPGFDGLAYWPTGSPHMASYPPPHMPGGSVGGGAHHFPPLGDPHRYPAAPPAGSNARWEQNPLATLADLTTTQTQIQHPAVRPPPLQSSLPSFNGGACPPGLPSQQHQQHQQHQHQGFEPYPYATHHMPRPQPVPAQRPTYQAPTPQYTPPESDQSKSQGGQGSSSHGSTSASASQRPSNASGTGQSGPRQPASPPSNDESGEPADPEQEALKPVFEAERWERGGGDGKAADFVERAAARYTGRDLEIGKAAEPGHNIDQSVVEALAPSPSSADMVRPLTSVSRISSAC